MVFNECLMLELFCSLLRFNCANYRNSIEVSLRDVDCFTSVFASFGGIAHHLNTHV